jgi:predicted RND superfamily exporter protein
MYGEKSRVVRWIRFVEAHLARADSLEIELSLDGRPLEDPATLGRVAALADALAALPELGPASSVAVPLAWLRRVLHGDDPAEERLAASARGNAELLELLAFEDPALLERWVSFDRRRVRVSVEAAFLSAARRGAVLEEVHAILERELPAGFGAVVTGPFAVGYDWVRDVQATQLSSFATAFGLVFGVVALYLRSLRLAAAALVPTLLPAVVVLGAMGWLGLSLDVGRAMIAAVLLGLGVDDAVHLLDRYRALRMRGEPPDEAMAGAVRFVGRAVVTTSLALALGFLSLMVSSWQTVSSFGFFVGIGIVFALVADLVVLPALLAPRSSP